MEGLVRHLGPLALVALIASLAVGCDSPPITPSAAVPVGPSPSASAGTPTTSDAPSDAPSPSPAEPFPSQSAPAGPTPQATRKPEPTPSVGWSRLRWRELSADDPLTLSRSVTAWRGGYVAVGRRLVPGDAGRNRVWVSADGSTWTTLPADTFGSGSAIVSVAASHDGVVALTLELGLDFCDDPPSSSVTCYDLTGPLRSWTSTDGTSWTAHPVDAPPPPEMTGDDEEHPVLESGVAPLLLLRSENRWQAVSNDGATWERLARRVFPRGMHVEGATAIAGRYVGVGNADGHPTELSSEDGRHWDAAPMRSCGGISASETAQALTSGPDGMIAQGFKQLENGVGAWAWCWSRDGRPWRQLPGFPPLGAWDGNDECRDVCPDGILVGDGEHLIAYGGDATQAAWASLDGRRWEPLRVTGSQPPRRRSGRYPLTMHLLPLGLLAQGDLGKTAWLGVPKP